MKHFFLSALIGLLFLSGCSKDFLKRYDKRIIGTWRITAINRIGGGGLAGLPFKEGVFTFNSDGTLLYRNALGVDYTGEWDIEKFYGSDDDGGNRRGLHLTVVNYSSQEILSEYYDDMNFVGTNHFKASVSSGFRTYVTHFRR